MTGGYFATQSLPDYPLWQHLEGQRLPLAGVMEITARCNNACHVNLHAYPAMAACCRQHSAEQYRFDPQLHLRYDGDAVRNAEMIAERLTPEEIVALERGDEERFRAVQQTCTALQPVTEDSRQRRLSRCAAGNTEFYVGYDGRFSALCHPEFSVDLRRVPLAGAWQQAATLHQQTSSSPAFTEHCSACALVDLCLWCPAHTHLETGRLDGWCAYFCQVAHARAAAAREVALQ